MMGWRVGGGVAWEGSAYMHPLPARTSPLRSEVQGGRVHVGSHRACKLGAACPLGGSARHAPDVGWWHSRPAGVPPCGPGRGAAALLLVCPMLMLPMRPGLEHTVEQMPARRTWTSASPSLGAGLGWSLTTFKFDAASSKTTAHIAAISVGDG